MFELKGPRKNKFRILGARIWVSFVRSGGAKTGGIAGSFEDFGAPGADEDGLKPGCIEVELIFARALSMWGEFQAKGLCGGAMRFGCGPMETNNGSGTVFCSNLDW